MIIAVVALAALCVIGVIALLYFKFRTPTGDAPALDAPVPSVMAATAVSAAQTGAQASPSAANAAGSSNPGGASSSSSGSAAAGATTTSGTSGAGAGTSGAAASSKEVGYLTLDCDPRCDQVMAGGRAFVPPIVREPFPPGSMRVTAKLGSTTKVISVIIVAGQSSPTRISMK